MLLGRISTTLHSLPLPVDFSTLTPSPSGYRLVATKYHDIKMEACQEFDRIFNVGGCAYREELGSIFREMNLPTHQRHGPFEGGTGEEAGLVK